MPTTRRSGQCSGPAPRHSWHRPRLSSILTSRPSGRRNHKHRSAKRSPKKRGSIFAKPIDSSSRPTAKRPHNYSPEIAPHDFQRVASLPHCRSSETTPGCRQAVPAQALLRADVCAASSSSAPSTLRKFFEPLTTRRPGEVRPARPRCLVSEPIPVSRRGILRRQGSLTAASPGSVMQDPSRSAGRAATPNPPCRFGWNHKRVAQSISAAACRTRTPGPCSRTSPTHRPR